MGQHQIIEKLRTQFADEISSERQVLYILVEIGKMLEHDKAKASFPTVTFYRDWVVHTKLDRSGVADSLVRCFDEYISSGNATATDRLKELVRPQTLREELKAYLATHHLTFPSCENGILWKRFVKYLAGVIDEVPLHIDTRKKKATRHVKSIIVSRSRNQDGRAMLTWEADCHTPPSSSVQTNIHVVLLEDFDQIHLP